MEHTFYVAKVIQGIADVKSYFSLLQPDCSVHLSLP